MAAAHVCFAMIISLSPGFARTTEYVVAPASESVGFHDTVSVRNIYQALPVQTGQKSPVRTGKYEPEKTGKPAKRQNPNSVFRNVVIKKLLQSM
jgi:hypothetical protein